jgi:hypothetical protein
VTVLSRPVALAGATVLLLGLAGCGGSSEAEKEKKSGEGFAEAADLSTCKADAKAARTPYGKGFPQDWPFPPQTVVFNAEDRGADGTIVTAVSALEFTKILRFMNHDVVSAGFDIEQGETEEHDAEAEWKGNDFHGRWAIRESAKCPGETVVQVLSAKG